MSDVLTVTLPALCVVPDVEVLAVGDEWPAVTGPHTITHEDIAAMIAAASDPTMPPAVLKIGHSDPAFNGANPDDYDGLPAIGVLRGHRWNASGNRLVVDIHGVPAWLAHIWPTAYPSRSPEIWPGSAVPSNTGDSSRHEWFLGALSLLGVSWPAIRQLNDLPPLFGIEPVQLAANERRVVHLAAQKDKPMPQLQPEAPMIAAVSMQEIRDALYARETGWGWVEEFRSSSSGLEAVYEDEEGLLWRIPVMVGDDDVISFGEPRRVRYTLEDVEDDEAEPPIAASATGSRVLARFAPADRTNLRAIGLGTARPTKPLLLLDGPVKAEAPPGPPGDVAPDALAEDTDPPPAPTSNEETDMTDAQLRERLGLPPDATDEEVDALLARAREALATEAVGESTPAEEPAPAPTPAGHIPGHPVPGQPVDEPASAPEQLEQPEQSPELPPVQVAAAAERLGLALVDPSRIATLEQRIADLTASEQARLTAAKDAAKKLALDGFMERGQLSPAERRLYEGWVDESGTAQQGLYDVDPEKVTAALTARKPVFAVAERGHADSGAETADSQLELAVDALRSRPRASA